MPNHSLKYSYLLFVFVLKRLKQQLFRLQETALIFKFLKQNVQRKPGETT